jgi:predicted ArsR family transcriptional regulator
VLAELIGTSQEAIRQHLKTLHKQGRVVRSGAGNPGDPHVFAIAPGERRLAVVEESA